MELKGIKMAVLGDSITEGHGVADKNNIYYNVVARECGIRGMDKNLVIKIVTLFTCVCVIILMCVALLYVP